MIDMCDSTITHSRFFKTVIYYYSHCRSWYFLLNIQFFPPNSFFMRGVDIQANLTNYGGFQVRSFGFPKINGGQTFQGIFQTNACFGTTQLNIATIFKIESKDQFIYYLRVFKRCENAQKCDFQLSLDLIEPLVLDNTAEKQSAKAEATSVQRFSCRVRIY